MLAIRVHDTGDESHLVLKPNTRMPDIAPSECLVEHHYAGLNFHDTYARRGSYPRKLPFVVGCEGRRRRDAGRERRRRREGGATASRICRKGHVAATPGTPT